jgi:F-type H+-transporting ATPase subunit b
MNLIDWKLVATQILGFLLMLWILRQFAWSKVLKLLEDRRQAIAGEFAEADRRKSAADEARVAYEQKIAEIERTARARLQEAVAEGQKVAGEIRNQAQKDATDRLARADQEIVREGEKAKEMLKERMIELSMRGAEKILRQKLDAASQRQLVSEFIDEVGAQR